MKTLYARLLKQLRKKYQEKDLSIVRSAFECALSAHEGQKRDSGEAYIFHSLEVAQILAELGLDPVTVAAGLLHDVIEDTPVTREQLKASFGSEMVTLVDGVTKIGSLNFAEEDVPLQITQAQNTRKMLVATAQDVRVILVKLADRLHNLRTVGVLSEERRRRIARETLDIYAPLADRLGISTWKWELEDLAFRQLRPEKYREMVALVAGKRRERERQLEKTIRYLHHRLAEAGVQVRVVGRPKHLYSIYQKMERQGKTFDELMDIDGVRIIAETESACYNALGAVHNMWPPMPGRFKDYIAVPKFNMYRAIHTTVMRENGKPLEIQIRTEEMDHTAREGIAAHWIYKEGARARDERLDRQLTWLRQMLEWLKDTHAPDDFMDSVAREFTPTHIYVFTPKGEVKELPQGATPLDFAYNVHSDIGHHCLGARVNHRIVPLTYNLRTGDIVEILTSKNQTPRRDWLDVVVTGKARARIRQRLRELGEMEPDETTRPAKDVKEPPHAPHPHPPAPPSRPVKEIDIATRQKLIRVGGAKNLVVQFAKCCDPMPGHAVVAYITKMPGITVHRADCKNFVNTPRDAERVVSAAWEGEGQMEAALRVILGQRPDVLPDLMEALRPLNIEILKAGFGPDKAGKYRFDFAFRVQDERTLGVVKRTLGSVSGVTEVARLRVDNVEERPVAWVG